MRNVRDYAIITATYWAFTLSDGALRMLVLLHLHEQGFSPLSLAMLFVLYEFFGMVTNLLGGWLGAKHGLKLTLSCGLLLQILACTLLTIQASALFWEHITFPWGGRGQRPFFRSLFISFVRFVVLVFVFFCCCVMLWELCAPDVLGHAKCPLGPRGFSFVRRLA